LRQQTGQAMVYYGLLCPLDGFEAAVRDFADAGRQAAATSPCPSSSRPRDWPRVCTPRAELAQAANVLRFDAEGGWLADNTDGVGLVRDISNAGVPLAGRARAADRRRRRQRRRAGAP
jgi:shikimate dehydrogenase